MTGGRKPHSLTGQSGQGATNTTMVHKRNCSESTFSPVGLYSLKLMIDRPVSGAGWADINTGFRYG